MRRPCQSSKEGLPCYSCASGFWPGKCRAALTSGRWGNGKAILLGGKPFLFLPVMPTVYELLALSESCEKIVLSVYIPNLSFLWAGFCYAQFRITQPLRLQASAKHGASVAVLGILWFIRKEFAVKKTTWSPCFSFISFLLIIFRDSMRMKSFVCPTNIYWAPAFLMHYRRHCGGEKKYMLARCSLPRAYSAVGDMRHTHGQSRGEIQESQCTRQTPNKVEVPQSMVGFWGKGNGVNKKVCELRGGEREHGIPELRKRLLAGRKWMGTQKVALHTEKGEAFRGAAKNQLGKHQACFGNKSNLEEKIHEHVSWCRRHEFQPWLSPLRLCGL